jgi:hypothetical protein
MTARPGSSRPLLTFTLALIFAAAVSGIALRAARDRPEEVVVGARGAHDESPAGGRLAACLDCHVPFVGTPSSRCLGPGCHGELATGTPPRDGPAMPIRFHAALRDEPCGRCHQEHGASTGAEPNRFDHAVIPDASRRLCSRCHSGATVAAHVRTDALSCDLCHGLDRWTGTRMEHARVERESCDACHLAPKQAPHEGAGGACAECHDTARWTDPSTP